MKKMRSYSKYLGVLSAFLMSVGSLSAFAADDVAISDLPASVQKTVKDQFPSGSIMSAEKEDKDGTQQYQVKVKNGSDIQKVFVKSDGSLVKIEKS